MKNNAVTRFAVKKIIHEVVYYPDKNMPRLLRFVEKADKN